jgi:hypothetical protein
MLVPTSDRKLNKDLIQLTEVNAMKMSLLNVAPIGILPSGNKFLVFCTAASGTLNFVTVPPIGFSTPQRVSKV